MGDPHFKVYIYIICFCGHKNRYNYTMLPMIFLYITLNPVLSLAYLLCPLIL